MVGWSIGVEVWDFGGWMNEVRSCGRALSVFRKMTKVHRRIELRQMMPGVDDLYPIELMAWTPEVSFVVGNCPYLLAEEAMAGVWSLD